MLNSHSLSLSSSISSIFIYLFSKLFQFDLRPMSLNRRLKKFCLLIPLWTQLILEGSESSTLWNGLSISEFWSLSYILTSYHWKICKHLIMGRIYSNLAKSRSPLVKLKWRFCFWLDVPVTERRKNIFQKTLLITVVLLNQCDHISDSTWPCIFTTHPSRTGRSFMVI